jgi:chromosome segregation protein
LYLAKLEINGFKSFPNRTQLSFEEGMMGVVGPNGCGKTNILDSIRWVLGEQRPTLLRSSKNDEVIFNGTSDLPPTDMAEVSLTVKNTSGLLPIEYDEVVITRRLYRSGESEYLINKKLCRLRDIHDLFADTGMSTHAYSVFHTGMIDAVLSENADERRFLFEEAAGITKYKTRKKDALKKLESTEADMLRKDRRPEPDVSKLFAMISETLKPDRQARKSMIWL